MRSQYEASLTSNQQQQKVIKILKALEPEQFYSYKFLPQLASLSQDKSYAQISCLLFSLYNILIRQDLTNAYNFAKKAQQIDTEDIGYIVALLTQASVYAFSKRHKESISLLDKTLELACRDEINSSYPIFFSLFTTKIIDIYDMSIFRREYFQVVQITIKKYGELMSSSPIIKALQNRRNQLQTKICVLQTRQKVQSMKSPIIESRFTRKSSQANLSSRAKSKQYDRKLKMQLSLKKHKYLNPYEMPQKNERCIFM